MIWHTVWFKLKDGVTEADKQAMLQGLRALPQHIDGIEDLGCGEDFCGRSQGFQIWLVVKFVSRAALESYGPHPVHQEFVTGFKHLWDDVMALDFDG